jgi:hypothetical protein
MDDKWEFLKFLPEIIRAAAADRLGILALLIIATALIGFFFFRRSRLWLRAATLGVFALGTAAFGTAALVRSPLDSQSKGNTPSKDRSGLQAHLGKLRFRVRLSIRL